MIAHNLARGSRYNPWADLAENWPEVSVVLEPMSGTLLGELRYPVIALRAGTSAAQRRCTLAHEIVHLERGIADWGVFADREEWHVHAIATRRLLRIPDLASAVRTLGTAATAVELALALDVDTATLRMRLDMLTQSERAYLDGVCDECGWLAA